MSQLSLRGLLQPSLLIGALLLGAPATAQMPAGADSSGGDMGGGEAAAMGGGGSAQGGMTGGAGAATPSTGGAQTSSSGPTVLFGLKPAAGTPRIITLSQALQQAAERNYDLRIAAEQIIQGETMIRKAWSIVMPRLNASGNYVYTTPVTEISFLDEKAAAGQRQQLESQALMLRTMADLTRMSDPDQAAQLDGAAHDLEVAAREIQPMDPIAIQPAHLFTGTLTFSMPLFSGRAIPLIQNAYDSVEQARLALDRARQQALYGVASVYFGAVTLEKMLRITESNERSSQSHLAATEARVSAGALPPIALKRAQYDLVRAQQTVRSTRSTYALLLGTLGQLIGEDTMFSVVAPGEVVEVETQGDADQFYSRAKEARLDMKGMHLALTVAERGITDYWMRYLPSLNLVGKANWTSNTSGFQTDPINYNVILAASLPLYDGGERYAARDESYSKIRAARLTIEKVEEQTAALIRGNLQDIQVRQEGLESSRLAVELSRENHENAVALFEVGAATNLEVIDANAAQLAAEIDLARSELEINLARLGLLFVVGEYPPLEGEATTVFAAR